MYAELQATLHNAWLPRKDGQRWTAGMWLPDYKPEEREWDWRKAKADIMAVYGRKEPDRQAIQQMRDAQADFAERQRQAREAQDRGASKEEIRLIMEA